MSILEEKVKEQVREMFKELQKPVKLIAFTQGELIKVPEIECEKCGYFLKHWKEHDTGGQENSKNNIPYCWEYFSEKDDNIRECKSCIIYKTQCLKCFTFFEIIPCIKNICKITCEDCGYFRILEKYMKLHESLRSSN